MIRFQGALIRDKGEVFAVVLVKEWVLTSCPNTARETFSGLLKGAPVVLAALDQRGVTYSGKPDRVRLLASYPVQRIPWHWYTVLD